MTATKGPGKPDLNASSRKKVTREGSELPLTRNAFDKAGGAAATNSERVWSRRRDVPLKTILATRPKHTVLIVHDDPTTRLVMRRAFTTLGVPKILEAGDTTDALEQVRTRTPDLVISEYEIAGGLEFLHDVRHNEASAVRALPVIMTISAPKAQRIRDICDAGAHEILVTPFSASALTRHIVGIFTEQRKHVETPTYIGPERRNGNTGFTGADRQRPEQK